MTANWSPVAQEERRQLCYGVWAVVGSTGRWPEVVNIWEHEGWDDLAASFAIETVGRGAQDRPPAWTGRTERPAYNIRMTSAAVAGPAPRRRASGGANSIVRTSSGEQVALHVRRRIFDGDLPPGTRVPQDEIAQELGVSRIPVREALIALEREGWVTIELHRGAFVNALDEGAIHDNYELFGMIYGFAAERAVARSDAEFVERLTAIQGKVAKTDDPQQLRDLSIAFHRTVVEAAASPRIAVVLRAMSTLVPGNFFELVPGAAGIEKTGFAAILRALRRADGEKTAAEYQKMMRRIGDQVARLFKDRGLLGPSPAST